MGERVVAIVFYQSHLITLPAHLYTEAWIDQGRGQLESTSPICSQVSFCSTTCTIPYAPVLYPMLHVKYSNQKVHTTHKYLPALVRQLLGSSVLWQHGEGSSGLWAIRGSYV